MMQISSLAGRSNNRGTVVIQTSQPDHPLIQAVLAFDYKRMAIEQLKDRKTFRYPPYYRLIVLVLRCNNEQTLDQIADRYAEMLYNELGDRVIPPFVPPVNRVQALYVRHIMLKLETTLATAHIRAILDKVNSQMQSFPGFSRIVLHYEVDN
jgi:primosomal protein N' (replication factor Y)